MNKKALNLAISLEVLSIIRADHFPVKTTLSLIEKDNLPPLANPQSDINKVYSDLKTLLKTAASKTNMLKTFSNHNSNGRINNPRWFNGDCYLV